MSRIPNERFAGLAWSPWWRLYQPELLDDVIFDGDGVLLRLAVGGPGGSLWFDDDDGFAAGVEVEGDFDVCADVQVYNLAGDDVPAGGTARVAGLGVHSPIRPPFPGWPFRLYVFRMFGREPGRTAGDAAPVDAYKINRATEGSPPPFSVSTYDTLEHPSPGTARGWIRLARVGSTVSSWRAGPGPEPALAAWSGRVDYEAPELPTRVLVGPMIYSSAADADISARIRAFINTPGT